MLKRKAFTLMEMLAVISLLGIFLTTIWPWIGRLINNMDTGMQQYELLNCDYIKKTKEWVKKDGIKDVYECWNDNAWLDFDSDVKVWIRDEDIDLQDKDIKIAADELNLELDKRYYRKGIILYDYDTKNIMHILWND